MPGQHLQQEARTATGTYVPVAFLTRGQREIGVSNEPAACLSQWILPL